MFYNLPKGDSAASSEVLLNEHRNLLPEAQQLQEKSLRITKATEQLVASGCFAGEEAQAQSYAILSNSSDYLSDLQQRDALLERVIAFFRSAQTVSSLDWCIFDLYMYILLFKKILYVIR